MSTLNIIGSAIQAKLTGGTALTALLASGTASIYNMLAPEGAAYPLVIYNLQAGGPLNITPSDMRDMIYQVRAYGTTVKQVGLIDAQISPLMTGGLSVTPYTNLATWRETDLETYEELPNGVIIYSAGAFYRVSLDN